MAITRAHPARRMLLPQGFSIEGSDIIGHALAVNSLVITDAMARIPTGTPPKPLTSLGFTIEKFSARWELTLPQAIWHAHHLSSHQRITHHPITQYPIITPSSPHHPPITTLPQAIECVSIEELGAAMSVSCRSRSVDSWVTTPKLLAFDPGASG